MSCISQRTGDPCDRPRCDTTTSVRAILVIARDVRPHGSRTDRPQPAAAPDLPGRAARAGAPGRDDGRADAATYHAPDRRLPPQDRRAGAAPEPALAAPQPAAARLRA